MEAEHTIYLSQLSKGSGCGCKIAPQVLEELLGPDSFKNSFPGLIIGSETRDDAAVMETDTSACLISTTDFFTPLVDDPYDFGRIAAANSISDIYAMGGKPALALAILGFPVDKLPVRMASEIMSGARKICEEAGIPIAGGHSIDAPEPFFGLAVNGWVDREHIKTNKGAKPGDLLFLTKPLGTGILAAALKRRKIKEDDLKGLVNSASELNKLGASVSSYPEVHAMTDITGFGLLGHLIEICKASSVSAVIDYDAVPLFPGLESYAAQMIIPDNTFRNWNAFEKDVSGITGPAFMTLCDPQTNGGLLIALDPSAWDKFRDIHPSFGKPIGRISDSGEKKLVHVIEKGVN